MIPLCEAEGIGVIPWSPLARGLLARGESRFGGDAGTSRGATDTIGPKLYDTPGDADVVAAVRRVAQGRGITPAEVSLAWLLSRRAVVAPIVGATKPEHLDAAVRAVDITLTADEIGMLEAPYRPHAGGWVTLGAAASSERRVGDRAVLAAARSVRPQHAAVGSCSQQRAASSRYLTR